MGRTAYVFVFTTYFSQVLSRACTLEKLEIRAHDEFNLGFCAKKRCVRPRENVSYSAYWYVVSGNGPRKLKIRGGDFIRNASGTVSYVVDGCPLSTALVMWNPC